MTTELPTPSCFPSSISIGFARLWSVLICLPSIWVPPRLCNLATLWPWNHCHQLPSWGLVFPLTQDLWVIQRNPSPRSDPRASRRSWDTPVWTRSIPSQCRQQRLKRSKVQHLPSIPSQGRSYVLTECWHTDVTPNSKFWYHCHRKHSQWLTQQDWIEYPRHLSYARSKSP